MSFGRNDRAVVKKSDAASRNCAWKMTGDVKAPAVLWHNDAASDMNRQPHREQRPHDEISYEPQRLLSLSLLCVDERHCGPRPLDCDAKY